MKKKVVVNNNFSFLEREWQVISFQKSISGMKINETQIRPNSSNREQVAFRAVMDPLIN